MIDPPLLEKDYGNRQNFLSLVDKVIFRKWHTEITLVINKEFSLTEIALINSGADMNLNALKCVKTQELFRPSK